MNIDVDFDVYKVLTAKRATEAHTYNDVLRELLGLSDLTGLGAPSDDGGLSVMGMGCVLRGVTFPNGTQFRATYKGQTYTASITGGRWLDNKGVPRRSPSDAAHAITRTHVNGWRFWLCKRPNDPAWRLMEELRLATG